MAKVIEQLSLMDVAPPSITGDKRIQHLITAIDPKLMSVSQDIREAFIVSRINELPEEVLDLLAWQWHVDFYELAHSLDAKRAMVLKSISWHRKKGTRGAILDALGMLGVEAKFTSWQDLQDEGAQPYTFVIDAKLTRDFWERVDWTKPTQTIRRAIEESKAARSWMSRLYVYMEAQAEHDITIGTGVFHGAHHDIAIVQGTYSASGSDIAVGAGIIQSGHHDIDMVQGTSANSRLDVSIGTGTFHTWRHEVKHVQATEAEADSLIVVGASVIQSAKHEVDIQQHTSGSASLDISIGTSAVQKISHDVKIQQATRSTTEGDISVGAGVIAGSVHSVNLNQPTSGQAQGCVPVGIGILQSAIHTISVGISTIVKAEIFTGTTLTQRISHALNLKSGDVANESVLAVSTGLTHGKHHDVALNQAQSGSSELALPFALGMSNQVVHSISAGMSTLSRTEIFTGTAFRQEISHAVDLKHGKAESDSEFFMGTGLTYGKHHDVALRQAKSASTEMELPVVTGMCNQITYAISAGMSTLSRVELFTGTATMQSISHNVGIKKAEGSSIGSFSAGCAIACGIHMQIKMAA